MRNPKDIKVAIVGLGPVGMIMAVKLKEAGCDVTLCVRNKIKLNQIKSEGIKLEGKMESVTYFDKIYSTIEEMTKAKLDLDFLVFALKSYQIKSAAKEALEFKQDDLTIVSAQNGIDVEELLIPIFGSDRVLRMVVNYAGNLSAPNVVNVTFFTPPNYIGSIDDNKSEEAKEFAKYLTDVGLLTKSIDSFEILKRSWEKTILNSSLSALCGVGRLTMAEAMADPDTVELIEQIISEAVLVAEAEKIRFPDDFIRQCMRYLRKGGNHFPSLAGDVINNRQTEIDYFNGKIVEYGKKHYVRTSLNLAFTNMVKAMTNKNISSRIPGAAGSFSRGIIKKGIVKDKKSSVVYQGGDCFLGVDLGSAYIKFTVIDEKQNVVFRYTLQTLNKERLAHRQVMQAIQSDFDIKYSCATGYGRKHFIESDIVKTEINCAAAGVSRDIKGRKNIIDIGGEDIKVIHCDENNAVANFYMNDKCAAGTGSFLSEIADRAEIEVSEMSHLAARSNNSKELNSFCAVFAKTEIMNWIFDGISIEDISKGIYLSIANKVAKMKLLPDVPTVMIGGVIDNHPYLLSLLNERFGTDIQIVEVPQHSVSLGAAIIAQKYYVNNKKKPNSVPESIDTEPGTKLNKTAVVK
ncbi:MAG: 2-dehydropantoate 2-reductase [Flavobacteriales bacterium]|nr:2-dehydropantoate 2-reductase [Flavobacteriales bacterium]